MSERSTFDGKTVVIAGAGCPAGDVLASGFAAAGGRVVAIDRDERRIHATAARNPEKIDMLGLNVLVPEQTSLFANVWEAEPLDVLIHLQPLRHADELPAAIASIVALTGRLSPGLMAGHGRVLTVFEDASEGEDSARGVFMPTLMQLAETLQSSFAGTHVTVNAICLPMEKDAATLKDLLQTATWLGAPTAPAVSATWLRLDVRGD